MSDIKWQSIPDMPWSVSATDNAGNEYQVIRNSRGPRQLNIRLAGDTKDFTIEADSRTELINISEFIHNFGNKLSSNTSSNPVVQPDKLQHLVNLVWHFQFLQQMTVANLAKFAQQLDVDALASIEKTLSILSAASGKSN